MLKTICCLDLEGVLVPEIWIAVAKKTRIKALMRTTRDEPNYDRLMKDRLRILKQKRIGLARIRAVIRRMRPLPGAKGFLKKLQAKYQVVLLSDTFYEFAEPLMKCLGYPTLFCNWLTVNRRGVITGYRLRQTNGKAKAVTLLRQMGFKVIAAGDSYNDLSMLRRADKGILFRPPSQIAKRYSKFPVVYTHARLLRTLLKFAA